MNVRQKGEVAILVLFTVITFMYYNPADDTAEWITPFVVLLFIFFGFLMDMLFSDDMSFVYDPNPNNWRRKTDPQS